MPKRKEDCTMNVITVIQELTPEEKAKRMERLVDTIAKINRVKGYLGCKFYPEQGYGDVYRTDKGN